MAIAVYGATGYTGRLVVEELRRSGAELVLGGRSEEKLARLAGGRGGARYVTASVDDPVSLRRLLDGCGVVINCAGPFTLTGEAVVEAAVAAGCHYLDSTGEQPYIRAVFDRHGAAAQRAGVALVPALGFDYAPGDCAARLAAREVEPVDELEMAYWVQGFGATRGTMRSALEMMHGGDVVYADGAFVPGPRTARRTGSFPEPIGPRPMLRYPAGEVITVPRHSDVRNVTAWIAADQFAPHRSVAAIVPFVMPAIAAVLRKPVRRVVGRAIDRLPEGPSEADRRAASFTVMATARSRDGRCARTVVRGGDVYGLTAAILARCAEAMAGNADPPVGALPPSLAFGAETLLDRLADRGLSYEVEASPPAG